MCSRKKAFVKIKHKENHTMTIGVVAAMQCEADILLGDLDIAACETRCGKPVYTGKAYGKDIALVVSGVGKVNAAIGAQMLIDIYHAHVLVNFGVAGGIRENTEITKVYQIAEAVQYDFDLSGPNGTRIGTLDEFQENFLPLAVLPDDILPARRLATGDRFNDSPDDFFLIRDYMDADIRDMEGGAVAQAAVHAGVPCYMWKAVSDKSGSGSSFEQYTQNKRLALENLHGLLPVLFARLKTEN